MRVSSLHMIASECFKDFTPMIHVFISSREKKKRDLLDRLPSIILSILMSRRIVDG